MLTRMPHVLIAWDWQGRRAVRVTRQIRVRPMASLRPFSYVEAPSLWAGYRVDRMSNNAVAS